MLILDGDKKELPEIMETYTDTWGKLVKIIKIRSFINNADILFSVEPEFENVEYAMLEEAGKNETEDLRITEAFHLEGVEPQVKEIYCMFKEKLLELNGDLIFNPQKYYVSIINKRNVAYFSFTKKKIRIVVMLPYEKIKEKINSYTVKELSQGVQNFYSSPCAAIEISDKNHLNELVQLLEPLVLKMPQ